MQPLVSVVIPVYNSAKYITETILSVLRQTYKNVEILAIDDASTDNSVEVIKSLAEKNSNLRLFHSPGAGRPSVPRNIGINNARGEFIAFLDSDDIWQDNKLAVQVDFLRQHPQIPLVYTASKTFGSVSIFSPFYEVLPLPSKAFITRKEFIERGNSITCSSVLTRRELLLKENGFDEDPEMRVEDYDLWIRLSSCGDFGFIPAITVHYRIHENQFSGNWKEKSERLRYLAEKRGLPIAEYKMIRNKGFMLLLIRNMIHFLFSLYYKIRGSVL